jgi:hypothetical protein
MRAFKMKNLLAVRAKFTHSACEKSYLYFDTHTEAVAQSRFSHNLDRILTSLAIFPTLLSIAKSVFTPALDK